MLSRSKSATWSAQISPALRANATATSMAMRVLSGMALRMASSCSGVAGGMGGAGSGLSGVARTHGSRWMTGSVPSDGLAASRMIRWRRMYALRSAVVLPNPRSRNRLTSRTVMSFMRMRPKCRSSRWKARSLTRRVAGASGLPCLSQRPRLRYQSPAHWWKVTLALRSARSRWLGWVHRVMPARWAASRAASRSSHSSALARVGKSRTTRRPSVGAL